MRLLLRTAVALQIPSNCIGKALNVRFAPWECSLYKNGTVACNPPFIEILTAPASCSLKYQKAGKFIGKFPCHPKSYEPV